MSYHKAQRGNCSVVHNALEQVMLDSWRRDVVGETLDAHIAKILDMDPAPDSLTKKFRTSSSFMAPIGTFCTTQNQYSPSGQEWSIRKSSKDENRGSHGSTWQYHSRAAKRFRLRERETTSLEVLQISIKTVTRNGETATLNDNLNSSKSSKARYNLQTDSKSDDEILSKHKRHNWHRRAQDSWTETNLLANCYEEKRRTLKKELPVIHPVSDRFREAY